MYKLKEDMMKKYLIMMLGVVLFSSPSAFAAGYGDAGCGLGSLVFGNSPGPVQILAATTNATSYSQPFGVSSGTSNCDAQGFDVSELKQEMFAENNFTSLSKEMAAGEGEHVTTLAGLLGCPSEKEVQFASYTQQNYQAIFASEQTTPEEMLQAVRTGITQHPELAVSCTH